MTELNLDISEFVNVCLMARARFEGNPEGALQEIEYRARAILAAPGASAPATEAMRGLPDWLLSHASALPAGLSSSIKTLRQWAAEVETARRWMAAPASLSDTKRLDWLLQSDAVTRHEDGTATFAFVFANADDLRGAIDDLMGLAPPALSILLPLPPLAGQDLRGSSDGSKG